MRRDAPYTESDFDALSWHDCRIWGVEFRTGDADEDDWTSDLALEIDFILEWQCGTLGSAQFRIAPASLVFHGVTDPVVRIDWATSRLQVAPYAITIDCIRREPVPEQKVYFGPSLLFLEDHAQFTEGGNHFVRSRGIHADVARSAHPVE